MRRGIRLGAGAGAIAAGLFALLHPSVHNAEGYPTGDVAVLLGLVVGLGTVAVLGRGPLLRAACWFGLVSAGQGAFLTLVRAGNLVGYQHFEPWSTNPSAAQISAWMVLGLQAAALCVYGRRVLALAVARLTRSAGLSGAVVLVAGFVLTASTLSPTVGVYLTELFAAALVQALQLWTVAVAAVALPDDAAGRFGALTSRFLDGPGDGRRPRLPLALAGGVVVVSAALAVFAYERHPHLPDEIVYLLHARYFAAGMLEMPLPPSIEGFSVDLMTVDSNRWFSPVPPGWPAVLAIGVLLGVPWLVNPVLGGLAVWLTYQVVLAVSDDVRSARLTTLLLSVSPWFLFLNMSLMTHTLTLVSALAAAWMTARAMRDHTLWVVGAGLSIGVVALIRPLEGLIVAVTLGLWSLFGEAPSRWSALRRTAGLTVATLLSTLAVLPYNRHLTGRWLTFPIMDYTDRLYGPGSNAMGFGPDRGLGWSGLDPFPGHGWLDVLVNSNVNLFQVNVELLGWSVGSMLVVLLGAGVAVARGGRGSRSFLAVALAVIGVHALYWFSGGPDFGARYWYLIVVPCLALASRGLTSLAGQPWGGGRVWAAGSALVLSAVLVFVPWRAVDKYHHYRLMRPDVRELARTHDFGDALVLIRGERHPDYASAGAYNPIDLQGPGPIYAWDRDPAVRAQVLAAFPDRPVWVIDGPRRTSAGYVVVAGPILDRSGLPEF
jgi:hypothetical protein